MHSVDSIQKRFGAGVKILLIKDDICILKTVELSYFTPSGKARLGTKTEYSIYLFDASTGDWDYWQRFSNKASAIKELRRLCRLAS